MSNHFFLYILIFVFNLNALLAQDVTLSSQEEVDAFSSNITIIEGNFIINGVDIVDLSKLINITSVEGELEIKGNNSLLFLNGLGNINSVQGNLSIDTNRKLITLQGLQSLTSIGGDLILKDHTELENIDGLENIISIGGDLILDNNSYLKNIDGLENINSIGRDLRISDNDELQSLNAFENIVSIQGDLNISNNPKIADLKNFGNLTAVKEDLIISEIHDIINLNGFENITSIGGNFNIFRNDDLLTLNGIENINTVGGRLGVTDNSKLTNIRSLANISVIEEDIGIGGNDVLPNLIGLEHISIVRGGLYVTNNDALINLEGLENITSVEGELVISSNDNLKNIYELEKLNFIGTNLKISSNCDLLNLDGLENITSSIQNLSIDDNNALQNLEGLRNIPLVTENFTINRNEGLQSLKDLSSLTSVGNFVTILENGSLKDLIGLENLVSIVGNLFINNNKALQNIDGLENLMTVGGPLSINSNAALQNIDGLGNLMTIGNYLSISNNAHLQNIDGLQSLSSIGEYLMISLNENLQNIDGLQSLTSIEEYLWIRHNEALDNINGLQSLTSMEEFIWIENNNALQNVDGLSNLTYVGESLRIDDNDVLQNLNGLLSTPTVIDGLTIRNNNALQNLDGLLNYSSLKSLSISDNDALLNLNGLMNITNIENILNIWNNPLLKTLDGLENIRKIGGNLSIINNSALLNIDGLISIDSIGEDLLIKENSVLENVNGLINISKVGRNFSIVYNTSLTNCCGIKHLLLEPNAIGRSTFINDNSVECNSEELIILVCESSTAKSCIYWDENENGVRESTEKKISTLKSVTNPYDIVTFTDSSGCHTHHLENGDHTVSYIPSPLWQLSSDSSVYHITISDNDISGLDFGFTPTDIVLTGTHTLVSGIPRCFREVTFDFNFRNEGNSIMDGRLFISLDSFTELSSFVHPADTIISDKIWEWQYENLYPGELLQRKAILKLPSFEIDSISVISVASAKTNKHPEVFFKSNYNTPILCAYDPNDKLVSPDREGDENYTLFDETLTYTIRFQNTGNDTAFTVIILDELDDYLDASSLKVIASSHESTLSTELRGSNKLSFNFENILLPDSTINFDGSQGYVTYSIKPKEGLAENSIIRNTASIYFDFNPPIVTNTTQNTMVSCLPPAQLVQYDTIYEVNTFELIDGSIVNETGTYIFNLVDEEGCDTLIFTTELEVLECPMPILSEVNIQILDQEEHILPDSTVVSEAGTYITEILDEIGCLAEIITTNLELLTSTSTFSSNEPIFIYPNPTSAQIIIEIKTQDVNKHQLTLTNIYGQDVLSKEVNQSLTKVNVEQLQSGIYIVSILNNKGREVATQKLIIVR